MADTTEQLHAEQRQSLEDHGLEAYYLVLLMSGGGGPTDADELTKLQEAHLANNRRLHDEGHLKVAGPFGPATPEEMRGVFILKAENQQHAEALVNSDPSIQAGRLKAQILEWYVEKGTF